MGERVISESAARQLTYMMSQVIERGTGRRARLDGHEAAGKTGTTSDYRDAWFIGFTADYVVGVWMGNDDNKPLTGVTGGGLPAEIWHEVMVRINEGVAAKPLVKEIPESTYAPVGGGTGEGAIAPEDVPYFDDPNAPTYDDVYIDPETGESIPVYEGPPPAGAVLVGPVTETAPRGDLVDQLLDGVLGGNN